MQLLFYDEKTVKQILSLSDEQFLRFVNEYNLENKKNYLTVKETLSSLEFWQESNIKEIQ